ncbi:hypothetical protein EJ06DRAFT_585673 [Trichodelitschia bisporula]|uniref:NOT2/NOT3/NOT5 C-terminal domain-containing protein n=1 Tax=Trichodelitschia bisporula TaxID=703511 RepID=A0A6G1HI96_9PEZI|nr:hypothetical protein EJ06DRAFT_585673 [Trichodelitschia bisporula]
MHRPGSGPQGLRQVPGNMFPPGDNRRATPAAARLQNVQNGKIGADPSWFGLSQNSAISSAQSRTAPGTSSFAQAISNQPQHRPIDLAADFPSLGGGSQPQQPQPGQQTIQQTSTLPPNLSSWANNVRPRSPERRAFMGGIGRGRGIPGWLSSANLPQSGAQQLHAQGQDETTPTASHFAPGGDGYHFGNQGGVPQLSGLAQQTSASQQQSRMGVTSPIADQSERGTGSVIGDDRFSDASSRQARVGRTIANPFPAQQDPQQPGLMGSYQGRGFQDAAQSTVLPTQPPGPEVVDSPQQLLQPQRHKRLAEMTEQELWGLTGLVAQVSKDSPDYNEHYLGMDLTQLGLDLESSEPLWPQFGSPFDERPVVPEFKLPEAYKVTNIAPLHSKIPSLTDETLIMIFYQYPRDILQELAAQELYKRDWRWHKELKQWMMKDTTYMQPIRINDKQERGCYFFFDVNNWRRERKEFLLNYDHLDQRHGPTQGLAL